MFRTPTAELREKLLGVHGIGPETADSILLYAGKHSVFVVDTYTQRILRPARHGSAKRRVTMKCSTLVLADFPGEAAQYNEFHALFVQRRKKLVPRARSPLLAMPARAVSEGEPLKQRSWTRKLWLAVGGLSVVLLAAAIFTLGSLRAPVHPEQGNSLVILFALSTFIFVAFLVFGLVLLRSLLRLWNERKAGLLGSRFKTKMVFGAMGVSLLPLVFLFFFSYALVNRTLNLWFPKPLEIANAESQKLLNEYSHEVHERLNMRAARLAPSLDDRGVAAVLEQSKSGGSIGLDAIWIVDRTNGIAQAAPPALAQAHLQFAAHATFGRRSLANRHRRLHHRRRPGLRRQPLRRATPGPGFLTASAPSRAKPTSTSSSTSKSASSRIKFCWPSCWLPCCSSFPPLG